MRKNRCNIGLTAALFLLGMSCFLNACCVLFLGRDIRHNRSLVTESKSAVEMLATDREDNVKAVQILKETKRSLERTAASLEFMVNEIRHEHGD